MIPVTVNGVELLIKPKSLLSYVDKLDFIKTRRLKPFDLIQGLPEKVAPDKYDSLVRMAMHTVYTNSSSVSWEEEVAFDKSEEGFFFELWRCLPEVPKEPWRDGIQRAREFWNSADDEEKLAIRVATNAADERSLQKN